MVRASRGRGSAVHQTAGLSLRFAQGTGRNLRCFLSDASIEARSIDRANQDSRCALFQRSISGEGSFAGRGRRDIPENWKGTASDSQNHCQRREEMMNPWWDPQSSVLVVWLCWVGPLDGLLGWLASRGRYRGAVLAAWIGIMVLYGVIGIAGILGLILGQPV